jgi:hypothetical protein
MERGWSMGSGIGGVTVNVLKHGGITMIGNI